MTPAQYDFSVVRGNSGPKAGLVFELQTEVSEGVFEAIPFTDVRLSIYNRSTLINRYSLSDTPNVFYVSDEYSSQITWSPTPADTRAIPKGDKATYEIEVWHGEDEITYFFGTITGLLGINDDESVS